MAAATALDVSVPAEQGPPLHLHLHLHVCEDEMYYVLDGLVRVKIDEQILPAPAGSFVFIPRGAPHCFQNPADEAARLFVMFTPAGMERFFERFAEHRGPVAPEILQAVAETAWMQVAGPPLVASDPL